MHDTRHDPLADRLSAALGAPPEGDWGEVERIARITVARPAGNSGLAHARTHRRRTLRRPRALAALAVALLLISGAAAAAISLTAASSPPVRLANGSGLCPEGYSFVADTRQNLVYPPNYPGLQPHKAADTRCFASVHDARTDGYKLASPPAGVTMFGQLYMGPTTAHVRRVCEAAQRYAHAVVYCPSRLPTPWLTPVNPDCPSAGCAAPELSISGSFAAPSSYGGSGPGEGEASLWSASPYQLRHDPVPLGCGSFGPLAHARLIGHASFRGHAAAWYECTGTGPTVLAWHIGRQSYGITADGPPGLRQRLVRYIAAHLVALRPR